ncbi:hypothetical protein [Streptomyces sp. NRRL S-1824]|uniref:hypothetical protein n=1 Tax=Streptomyces sp. NRRL S-1824 TaxID=1463889 RepID=UPI000559EFD5|nr:hypothetical protein [Streptomyces sp. NRRL S-1824]
MRHQAWVARSAGVAGAVTGVLWRALPSLLGVGLVAYGAWLAWRPAGFLAAGALLLADQVADRLPARKRVGGLS